MEDYAVRALKVIAITIMLGLLPSAHADAAATGGWVGFFLGGNVGTPFGRVADESKLGFGGMAGLSLIPLPRSAPDIALRIAGGVDLFPGNLEFQSDFNFYRAGLDIRLNFARDDNHRFYLVTGGGFARVEIDQVDSITGVAAKSSENTFYYSPGVGVEFFLFGNKALFVEGKFIDILGDPSRDYQYLQFSAGISF